MFNVSLWSFGVLVTEWPETLKRLVVRQTCMKFKALGCSNIYIYGQPMTL